MKVPLSDNIKASDQFLQEELILLAHRATERPPKFTAADFFTVDYRMLYTMFETIVSYIVIIIQLR